MLRLFGLRLALVIGVCAVIAAMVSPAVATEIETAFDAKTCGSGHTGTIGVASFTQSLGASDWHMTVENGYRLTLTVGGAAGSTTPSGNVRADSVTKISLPSMTTGSVDGTGASVHFDSDDLDLGVGAGTITLTITCAKVGSSSSTGSGGNSGFTDAGNHVKTTTPTGPELPGSHLQLCTAAEVKSTRLEMEAIQTELAADVLAQQQADTSTENEGSRFVEAARLFVPVTGGLMEPAVRDAKKARLKTLQRQMAFCQGLGQVNEIEDILNGKGSGGGNLNFAPAEHPAAADVPWPMAYADEGAGSRMPLAVAGDHYTVFGGKPVKHLDPG